ncbi:MAG: glycosyltransferase, partial [Nitrospirae bacterium]|nr:glycosyltransferase [Nitrospirota bacterium]
MIKVCMLTYAMPPEHSGAAKQAITLATKLFSNGVEIFFVTQGNKAENLRNQNVAGFRVIRIYKETLFWKILAPLRFFIALIQERRNFDIIHVHGVGYLAKIAVAFGLLFRKK